MIIKYIRTFLPSSLKWFIKFIFSPKYHVKILINDIRSYFGKKYGDKKIIFVAGYPKSGTTWVENFISNLPGYSPRSLSGSKEMIRHHHLPKSAFTKMPKYGYSSIKTHILPYSKNINILLNHNINKIIVMYRDPRDIAISQYHHVLKTNPWLATDKFYEDYNKMDKNDAIQHSIDMVLIDYSSWVKGWLDIEKNHSEIECMTIKYEDLRSNSPEVFKKILKFYGVDLNDYVFNKILTYSNKEASNNIFSTLSSLNPGTKSTKRTGKSGEWITEMNSVHKKCFKDSVGDLLIELGYEKDHDW
jgi:hypothetical protein